jgi:hypothetical protein
LILCLIPSPASTFIRTPVFWGATTGLGLAYLGGALVFAHTDQVLNFGWLSRFDFGPSLLLGVLILYGGAWLFWRRSGGQPPQRAGWRGAAYGVLIPLAIIVLVGGLRWSGKNGQGESNFPLSWNQKNQPANGLEPNMMRLFAPRQSAG